MKDELRKKIESIEITHNLVRQSVHGLKPIDGDFIEYSPSRFIYCFFVFNALYEVDWKHELGNSSANSCSSATAQFSRLVSFLHESSAEPFVRLLRETYEVDAWLSDFNSLHFDNNTSKSSRVFPEKTIEGGFLSVIEKVILTETTSISEDEHIALLQQVYAVRNNLFHGVKRVSADNLDNRHIARIKHYGSIVEATNEWFFLRLKESADYHRVYKDDAIFNMKRYNITSDN